MYLFIQPVWFHHRREIDLVSLYSWFDFIIFERLIYEDVSYSLAHSLSHGHGHGLVWCNTSAVHLHSFRFAGGSLTAAAPPFSENVVFITLWIGLISSSSRDCFMMVLWLYSCVDFISSRDCFMKMYLILSTFIISWLVWCNTSAVHLHSFRFAGGSLTAAAPPFSENVGFITLWIGLISSSSRDCFSIVYHSLDWFHLIINERMFHWCISIWIPILSTFIISWLVWCNTSAVHFHSFRFAGGSLTAAAPPFSENVGFITLWIGLIWFDFISPRESVIYVCMTLFLVWFHIFERLFHWCISSWILFSRHSLFHGLVRLTTIRPPSSLFSLRRWKSYGLRCESPSLDSLRIILLFRFITPLHSSTDSPFLYSN